METKTEYNNKGMEMTGREFIEQNVHQRLYKLTSETLEHNGHVFHRGRNVDTAPWQTGGCSPGGFYFTNNDELYQWIDYADVTMKYVWDVEIPGRARVYINEAGCAKTDQIILENIRLIEDLEEWRDLEFQRAALRYNGEFIRYIRNPSQELKEIAIGERLSALQYIPNPSPELQIRALQIDLSAAYFIRNLCDRAREILHVCEMPSNIIDYPDADVQLQSIAVDHNDHAMKYIADLDRCVALIALENNPKCVVYKYAKIDEMGDKAGRPIFEFPEVPRSFNK